MRRLTNLIIATVILISFFILAAQKMERDARIAEDDYLAHVQIQPTPANYAMEN